MTKKQFENAYRKYASSDMYCLADVYAKPSEAKKIEWFNRTKIELSIAKSYLYVSTPKIISHNKYMFTYAFRCVRKTDDKDVFVVVTKDNIYVIEEEKLPKIF